MKFFYHEISITTSLCFFLLGLNFGHHKGPRPLNAPNSPKKGIKNRLSICGNWNLVATCILIFQDCFPQDWMLVVRKD
jgi:hypothetical protein